jgi:hypothetical protein
MSEKHERVPVFAGDEKKFPAWAMAFKAHCKVRKCKQALTKNPNLPVKELDEYPATEEGKKHAKAVEQNDEAISQLTLALQGEALLGFIEQTYTDEFPDGLAYQVMELLNERYTESAVMKEANLNDELAAIRMGETEDPSKMLDTLATIKARYTKLKVSVTETSLMAHALAAAPAHYKGALIQEQNRLGDKATLNDFRKLMVSTYKATYGAAAQKREQKEDTKEVSLAQLLQGKAPKPLELALAAVLQKYQPQPQQQGQFRGECFRCKKKGHKISECPEKADEGAAACTYCGMTSPNHNEANCWLKEGNTVPQHAIKKLQQRIKDLQMAVVEKSAENNDGENDMILCQFIQAPDLKDQNLFVADSGASVHSTGNMAGMTELKRGDDELLYIQADGTVKVPLAAGKLPATVCNKHGEELQDVVLDDVQYFENQPLNLFSTNRLVTAGWTPGGDKNAIWFTKGKHRLLFDVKIHTKKGCLFAINLKRRDEGIDYISVSCPVLSDETGEGEDEESIPLVENDDNTAPSDEEADADEEDKKDKENEPDDDEAEDSDDDGNEEEPAEAAEDDDADPPAASMDDDKDEVPATRSGRLVRPPTRYKMAEAVGSPLQSEEAGEGFDNEAWTTVTTKKARFKLVSRMARTDPLEGRV